MGSRVYVGNLPFGATSEDLKKHLSGAGTVTDAKVMTDRETGRSRGFGFVTFATEAMAQDAIAGYHQQDFMGRNLVVNEALDRPTGGRPSAPRTGGYSAPQNAGPPPDGPAPGRGRRGRRERHDSHDDLRAFSRFSPGLKSPVVKPSRKKRISVLVKGPLLLEIEKIVKEIKTSGVKNSTTSTVIRDILEHTLLGRTHEDALLEAKNLKDKARKCMSLGDKISARKLYLQAAALEIESLSMSEEISEREIASYLVEIVILLKEGTGFVNLPSTPSVVKHSSDLESKLLQSILVW